MFGRLKRELSGTNSMVLVILREKESVCYQDSAELCQNHPSRYPQMPYADPISAHATVVIRDPEVAAESLAAAGMEVGYERIEKRSAFGLTVKDLPLGATHLVRTEWNTDTWLRINLIDHVGLALNPSNDTRSVFTTPVGTVCASAKMAPIGQPDIQNSIFRPSGAPLLVLTAEMKELERLFREITGADAGRLEFASALDRESPEGRRIQRLINYTVNELREEPSAVDNPIIRRQLDDLVLSAFLSLPGSHHRLIDRSRASVGSAVVRRAEEFMEAHVGRPIGMSDVAVASGCSRTKLFQAFRQERAWTPLQFLVRRRMERARRRLLAPPEDLTITIVALDCGYASFSQFAQAYRKLYGETPSTTLNRNR